MRHQLITALVLASAVTAAGCAEAPQADIDAANAAQQQAVTAQASEYAPESFRAAQDAQTALQAELKVQEDKFAITRSYTRATELAAAAKTAAEKAQQDAAAGRDMARNDAMTLIADAKTSLTQAREMLAKAPRGKGTQQDLEAFAADLTNAETQLVEAETAFATDRFVEARTKAEAARTAAGTVTAAVEQAMAARTRR